MPGWPVKVLEDWSPRMIRCGGYFRFSFPGGSLKPSVVSVELLSAQRAVTDAFVANGPRRDLIARVVRSLAENLGFDFATVWTCTPPSARVQCSEAWSRYPEKHAEFSLLTQGVSFAPGTDIAGRVWETGACEWIEDVTTHAGFLRGAAAARAGLSSALAVAYRAADRSSGVIELLSEARRSEDAEAVSLVEAVACQLSAYLERAERLERRGLLAGALDVTQEIVAVLDRDGVLLDTNDAGRRLLGVLEGQPIGDRALPQPDWARRFLHGVALPAALAQGSWTGETALVDPRRGEVSALTELIVHRGTEGAVRHVFATFRGIDELVSIKRRAWQVEKLEALSRLAGAVANDFNNMLTVITGYSHLVAETFAADDGRREQLAQLDLASQQAASLIHQLFTIGAQPSSELTPVDLWAMLHDMTRLIRSIAGTSVEVKLVRETSEGLVLGDPVQLEQIVVNLVDNARDALPRGGRITIELSVTAVPVEGEGPLPVGTYVVIGVSDTGVGMTPATQTRLFEPFFTTKRGSRGLGLAAVLGAARQAGGHVLVDSEPGRGSTFRVYLPRLESSAVPVQAPAAARTDAAGTETVLIVEDEAGVRALARRALERFGYRVIEADGSQAALEVCGNHQGQVHIVLLDMVMPGLSGTDLAERLIAQRPDMRILFMTGHSESATALHRALPSGAGFLEKPFVPATLARAVRTNLDRPQGKRRNR